MVRKRIEFKPIQLGAKEKIAYTKACEIAKACDNLPPIIEEKENDE
tara:strand:+ start:740 stop:877 length:138 start_codon:yes stop_codon:yes gene_type:complete